MPTVAFQVRTGENWPFCCKSKNSGELRTGSVAFEATLWQNLDQLYDKVKKLDIIVYCCYM